MGSRSLAIPRLPCGAGPFRAYPRADRWAFRRGFLDAVAVTPPAYLDPAWPDLPRPPTLRHVEIDLTDFEVSAVVVECVPESVARENVILPLGYRGDTLVLAMRDP